MQQSKPAVDRHADIRFVLARFTIRLALVALFAGLAPIATPFAPAFATLLLLTAVPCAVAGALRRESIVAPIFTNWDEAAAFSLLGRGVVAFAS